LFQDKENDNEETKDLAVPSELIWSASEPDESDPYRGYWVEYYEPKRLTMLDTLFAFTMNGTTKYRPYRATPVMRDGKQM